MPVSAGTKLGPYEILAPIGAGGMGEVYRAHDTRLDRDVAIKVLPAHLSSSAKLRERFDREARAISRLNHPHVCTLYDVGHQDGVDYLVMEYLEGETLADAVVYEMVTGRRAFEGPSRASLIAAIMEREPAPMKAGALDDIVRRCLAKNPDDRYQSARDLEIALGSAGVPAGWPGGVPRRRPWLYAFAVIIVVAIVAYWLIAP